jgi:hypothetical protein
MKKIKLQVTRPEPGENQMDYQNRPPETSAPVCTNAKNTHFFLAHNMDEKY